MARIISLGGRQWKLVSKRRYEQISNPYRKAVFSFFNYQTKRLYFEVMK